METIVACRSQISDRFPVASFAIRLPPTRYYEVACATDPRLFHSRHRRQRTPANFFTTRQGGLLRANRGETAWMLPPDQLLRFAGARRVFYALASYGSPSGDDAHFTIAPTSLDQVPSIGLSSDFTGRGLDRSRIGHPRTSASSYGGDANPDLVWGGDLALADEERRARDGQAPADDSYDDGHDTALWHEGPSTSTDGAVQVDPTENPDQQSEDPSTALAIAAEAGAQCDDVPSDVYGGAADRDDGDVDRDDEDDELASGASAVGVRAEAAEARADEESDDGDDPEDTFGGYEDAAALYGAAVDAGAVVEAEDSSDMPPIDVSEGLAGDFVGRDPDYRQEEDDLEPLVEPHSAVGLSVRALDIPEKVRLLRVIARSESGPDSYSAINPDREYSDPGHPAYHRYHIGLSWGFIQFTQRGGALGKALRAAHQRAKQAGNSLRPAERFESLFGPDWQQLLDVTGASTANERVAPVGGHALWEPVWTDRFRAAGRVGYVAAAQNEVAIGEFVDPVLPIAAWLGFTTPRAIGLLVDRVIHMGLGGGLTWVLASCGPLLDQARWSSALAALGCADLAAFQRSKAPHLRVDNRFGPRVHAALIGALRELGERSPIPIPDRDSMLRRLLEAAEGRRFAQRVRALYENHADFDDSVVYELPRV